MQKNKKILIIAAVVLLLIAGALLLIEGSKKPVPIEGSKTITVTVIQEGVEDKAFLLPPWTVLPLTKACASGGTLRTATAMILLSALIPPPLPTVIRSRSFLPPIKPAA